MLSGDTKLTEAILDGDVKEFEKLMDEREKEINTHPEQNRPQLKLYITDGGYIGSLLVEVAAASGHIDILIALKKRRYNLSQLGHLNTSADPQVAANALYSAIVTNRDNVVRYLLTEGVNPHIPFISPLKRDERLVRLITPLAVAAAYDHEEIVKVLLEYGVNPTAYVTLPPAVIQRFYDNQRVIINRTTCPMQDLIVSECPEGMRLIDKLIPKDVMQVNYNVVDEVKRSLLHYAVVIKDIDILKFLLSKGVIIDPISDNGETPLLYCLDNASEDTTDSALECIKLLIAAKANPRFAKTVQVQGDTIVGATPLLLAASLNSAELIKLLIAQGVDPNSGSENQHALHYAVIGNHLNAVKALLDAGAKTNIPDDSGVTPLFDAVNAGNTQVIALLLDKGADVNFQNEDDETPLSTVISSNLEEVREDQRNELRFEMLRIMFNHGADPRKLRDKLDAVRAENPKIYEYVINAIQLREACDTENFEEINNVIRKNPIVAEMKIGDDSILHYLIKNSKEFLAYNEDPLEELIKFIIDHGVPKHTRNKEGKTPLMLARQMKMVQFNDLLTWDLDNKINYIFYSEKIYELVKEFLSGAAVINKKHKPTDETSSAMHASSVGAVQDFLYNFLFDRINILQSFVDMEGLEEETKLQLKKLIDSASKLRQFKHKSNFSDRRMLDKYEAYQIERVAQNLDTVVISHLNTLTQTYANKSTVKFEPVISKRLQPVTIPDPQIQLLKQAAKPTPPGMQFTSQAEQEVRPKPAAASESRDTMFGKPEREKPEPEEKREIKRPRGKGSDSES